MNDQLPRAHGNRWLDAAIEGFRSDITAEHHKDLADTIELLRSERAEAEFIRKWLKKRHGCKEVPLYSNMRPVGYGGSLPLPCEEWEAALFHLAEAFSEYPKLSLWDLVSMKERREHADRVATHARQLADALEEAVRPEYPPLLALFNDADILRIAKNIPNAVPFVAGTDLPPQEPPFDTPAGRFAFLVVDLPALPHQLPSVLRRLADQAEESVKQQSLVKRPATGSPDERAFANRLSQMMVRQYGRPWDAIVANCVSLRYLQLDADRVVTEDTIRKWTGRK